MPKTSAIYDGFWFDDESYSPQVLHPFPSYDRTYRTKSSHPYSYDPFFIWGNVGSMKLADDCIYSDRIWQWDYSRANELWKKHVGPRRWDNASHKSIDAFMSAFLGYPVTATALAEGCNVSNGYPYWIIWVKSSKGDYSNSFWYDSFSRLASSYYHERQAALAHQILVLEALGI